MNLRKREEPPKKLLRHLASLAVIKIINREMRKETQKKLLRYLAY